MHSGIYTRKACEGFAYNFLRETKRASRLKTRRRAALLTALLFPGAVAARDDETAYVWWGGLSVLGDAPNYLDVGAGVLNLRATIEDEDGDSAAGRVEMRGGKKLWFVGPAVGFIANTDGGIFG